MINVGKIKYWDKVSELVKNKELLPVENALRIENLVEKIEALEKQVEELNGEKKRHDVMEMAISALNAKIDQNSTVNIEIDTQAMAKSVAKKLYNAIMNGNIVDDQIEHFVKVLDRIQY